MPGDVFRPGGVTYLRIPAPAPDTGRLASFYKDVFGWKVRDDESPAFEDGRAGADGQVIGHFMADLPVAGEAGVIPYIYVDSIDETLALVEASGGRLLAEPYPEGTLWVATVFDPAGNVVGVWQNGPRT
jgi:uncharacterized protein